MRTMGHSSITMTMRYVHPTPATMENAFGAMEELALPLPDAVTPATPETGEGVAPRMLKGVAKG
jgi:hypothetical protein